MRTLPPAIIALAFSMAAAAPSMALDYPLASCKSYDATVVERSGVDGRKAVLKGEVTEANLREYCTREPAAADEDKGPHLTVDQCVAKLLKSEGKARYSAVADCATGTIASVGNDPRVSKVRFPLAKGRDTSCGSGIPPVIGQFKLLCPKAAARMHLQAED